MQPTPIGDPWWPSRHGAADERGAANLVTPARVKAALALVETGEVIQLGRLYERGMPSPPHRSFHYQIPAGLPPEGDNARIGREDFFAGTLGQIGTQLDGLGHVGVRLPQGDTFYNGFTGAEVDHPDGLRRLGIEHVGALIGRAVLLDLPRVGGVDRLPGGTAVTVAMLRACLDRSRVTLAPGDCVLLRTGHGQLWMRDNEAYHRDEPGLDLEAGRWLAQQDILLVGADQWGIEVHPADPRRPIQVHQEMITRHGIYFVENLDLDGLAASGRFTAAFVFVPLRWKGAVGSPGNPIVIL